MDFLTSTVLTGVLYDGFKNSIAITSDFLRDKLQGWLVDDALLETLAEKVNALELRDYGEHVIERKLNDSAELQKILELIKPEQSTNIGTVTQSHSGSGDNVVGIKTVYHK
jgi:hypothetical protein